MWSDVLTGWLFGPEKAEIGQPGLKQSFIASLLNGILDVRAYWYNAQLARVFASWGSMEVLMKPINGAYCIASHTILLEGVDEIIQAVVDPANANLTMRHGFFQLLSIRHHQSV